ncbi:MAG: hypothetical protein FWG19_00045 [Methanomassiliicoccaceae archaeon]|nr:hypothetical protein [Methanomassiliicoccaceae archaeon]
MSRFLNWADLKNAERILRKFHGGDIIFGEVAESHDVSGWHVSDVVEMDHDLVVDLVMEAGGWGGAMTGECILCGCDDLNACVTPAGPCHWIIDGKLCSACEERLDRVFKILNQGFIKTKDDDAVTASFFADAFAIICDWAGIDIGDLQADQRQIENERELERRLSEAE